MISISAELTESTRVRLYNGRHEWRADEPFDKGGEDTGPAPYEHLLASLAACTLITLQLYCQHKGIRLERVSATYTYDKVEKGGEDGRKQKTDRLSSKVEIVAPGADDAQRARLAQIVSRCPVHRTLEAAPELVDEVSFG